MCFGVSARYLNIICIHAQCQPLIPCELAVTNVVFFFRMFMKNVCRILVCPVFVAEFFTQETKKFIALWPRVTRASKIQLLQLRYVTQFVSLNDSKVLQGLVVQSGIKGLLHGGGGPQVGEVTRLGERLYGQAGYPISIWSRLHDRWGYPPNVTSPT